MKSQLAVDSVHEQTCETVWWWMEHVDLVSDLFNIDWQTKNVDIVSDSLQVDKYDLQVDK